MQVGMIGLGRMGANMTVRLLRAGHSCVVQGRRPEVVNALAAQGAVATGSLAEQVRALRQPRSVWLMVPAAAVDDVLAELVPHLDADDVVIDGGNSHYRDAIRRAAELRSMRIHFVDVGTSGGIAGLERGYCLMIGGEDQPVARLQPLFAALAPGEGPNRSPSGGDRVEGTARKGFLHCGPHGAGHFVKMVHNGIEYGVMAAYAEGLGILRQASTGQRAGAVDAETAPLRNADGYRYDLDLPAIAEVWRHGSVISSWLLDLTAAALASDPLLDHFEGHVSDSGEGRWSVQAAVEAGVPVPVLSAALYARFSSRGNADFSNRVLSAMRQAFGGHREPRSGQPDKPTRHG